MKNAAGRFALFLVGFYLLSGGVQAQTITSLTLSPSTITGGSSGASTGTVFLNTPAPAGGTVVALSSSNTALAASLPSVTVAEGATSATFTVVTNPRYRDYSGLSFTATISASANGSSASANLTVTAHPLPPDITSNNGVYEGFMCGGNYPAYNGEPGILYQCFKSNPPSNSLFGPCIFIQECLLGCQRNPPNQTKFKDSCSITGAYPVSVNPTYVTSGDRVPGTLVFDPPSQSGQTASASAASSNARVYPYYPPVYPPVGTTNFPFEVRTSYISSIEFVAIHGNVAGFRTGLTWLTMVPPDPPPAQPIPTLFDFDIVGANPVISGPMSITYPALVSISLTGVSSGAGPTITLSSSNPAIASVPASVTIPAGSFGAQTVITTPASATTTDVTLTATDGRFSFSSILTVQPCTPKTCAAGNCGTMSDGCGGTLTCSTTPTTCAAQGKNCGTISDGCGGTLTCGTCTAPQVCGGGGILNVCGIVVLQYITAPTFSVAGGTSWSGWVVLTSGAPAGGAVVALSSNNAAASVPPSVTVLEGGTGAIYTITTKPVTTSQTATISASYGGVTKSTLMGITPADTVAVTLAQYDTAKHVLQVQATSSSATATLVASVTATGQNIGTLFNNGGGKYSGQFSGVECCPPSSPFVTNPSNITLKSNLGGSATGAVTAK